MNTSERKHRDTSHLNLPKIPKGYTWKVTTAYNDWLQREAFTLSLIDKSDNITIAEELVSNFIFGDFTRTLSPIHIQATAKRILKRSYVKILFIESIKDSRVVKPGFTHHGQHAKVKAYLQSQ